MAKTAKKWARHVHMKPGAMKGRCAKCPASKRRTAIRSVVRSDGFAVAIRRLNFLQNVANRRNNAALHTVTSRDLLWAERTLGKKRQPSA
jgi:hypothetical protein